jgi:hypothetical protein
MNLFHNSAQGGMKREKQEAIKFVHVTLSDNFGNTPPASITTKFHRQIKIEMIGKIFRYF